MFSWIPWDVWLAALAAIIVGFAAIYELEPLAALILYFALGGAIVIMAVNEGA